MKKKIPITPLSVILFAFAVLAIYMLLDYFNVPAIVGIDASRLNTDLLGIITNVITAIVVFAFGYFFIDQWNIKKLSNQRAVAKSLLLSVYKECLSSVELLDVPQSAKSLYEQTDGNKKYNILDDPSPHMKFARIPFINESFLFEYFKEGILDSDCFNTYLEIKSSFNRYVCVRVILFDCPNHYMSLRNDILNKLHQQISFYES